MCILWKWSQINISWAGSSWIWNLELMYLLLFMFSIFMRWILVYFSLMEFGYRAMKTSKLCITGSLWGKPPVTGVFPSQRVSIVENVSMLWCHHDDMTPLYSVHWRGNTHFHSLVRYHLGEQDQSVLNSLQVILPFILWWGRSHLNCLTQSWDLNNNMGTHLRWHIRKKKCFFSKENICILIWSFLASRNLCSLRNGISLQKILTKPIGEFNIAKNYHIVLCIWAYYFHFA